MVKDHQVTIHTTDGEHHPVDATAEDARYLEELPFNSENVSSVTVVPPK